MPNKLAQQINDALPQTQCTKCGYPACNAYADAIASGRANYNQCPPGGAEGITRIATILGAPIIPLNTTHGTERRRPVAVIEEALCIGCTLCIQACPVDAIIGAAKYMHTVIPDLCTGCDLCVAPCPVDCITMENTDSLETGWAAWSIEEATAARQRFEAREMRLVIEKQENDARLLKKAREKFQTISSEEATSEQEKAEQLRKKKIITDAIARATQKLPLPTSDGGSVE